MLNVYFDTNILENKRGKDLTSLSKCGISINYFEIAQFVKDKFLENEVSLNIPLIVLLEIKQHIYEGHIQKGQSIIDSIESAKRLFDSVLDLDYTFKYNNFSDKKMMTGQIEDYIDIIVEEFLNLPINKNLSITPFPPKYESLIDRAVKRRLPFFAHANAKITDAGFKDAMLLESILENTDFENDKVILFTNDNNFFRKEEYLDRDLLDRFFVALNTAECLAIIARKGSTTIETEIVYRLERDKYLLSRLFESINQPLSRDSDDLHISKIEQKEAKNEYHIQSYTLSNEIGYLLEFDYDNIANDFLNVTYSIEND